MARETRESFFDDLATGLANGGISRRGALKSIGAGAVAFAIGPFFPEQAEALTESQHRQCRRRGGLPVARGECNCALTCCSNTGFDALGCEGNPECTCFKTIEGGGFCGVHGECEPCTTSAECTPDWRCVVSTCCGEPTCLPPCTADNVATVAASDLIGQTSGSSRGRLRH
jgi:hypothetical protein